MAGVWLDDGIKAMLDATTGVAAFPTMTLRLFKNNITPTDATVLADFTEADFAGYAAVVTSGWSAAAVAAHVATATAAAAAYAITAGTQNIYGWYATNAGNTKAYWAERDAAAPVALAAAGLNAYVVTPTLGDKDTAT